EFHLPSGDQFIPNDTYLDQGKQSFALITGPNMAGKSTYIRQVALIQILFQMGSFVPAEIARLSPADRIFTRIGAGDDLSRGESTFFVEMLETASILNQHTKDSLIVMDEIGRGTSTYDGLAIARSVAEYLTEAQHRPRCLFATHYHELTDLSVRPGVFTLTVQVEEHQGKVVFLRKVVPG
ncbi:MAG: DNA mismatch repair protein MutS, partial [Leptospiraceae bacterium]|nr:DNA mismatch repair protein MutS [Leptospiraceae bacterium]